MIEKVVHMTFYEAYQILCWPRADIFFYNLMANIDFINCSVNIVWIANIKLIMSLFKIRDVLVVWY